MLIFTKCLVGAFDWEEILYSSRNKYGTWIHHQQQSRMIYTVRDHAVEILFGIAIGIGKDPVIDSHGQRGDVTRGRRDFNSIIQGCNMCDLKAATTGARNVDPLRINFRASE